MYKFPSKQIKITDFGQPIGMKMSPDNRWVKKAEQIPWDTIEQKYAKLFRNRKGNVAKPLRLALGACIIQAEYGFSDEETVLQIQEAPYLQYFCGMAEYKYQLPFDPSLMVWFRKRLTPEILGEINEMIIQQAEARKKPVKEQDKGGSDDPPDSQTGGSSLGVDPDLIVSKNEGTLIVDATCAPSNIRFPTDTGLLNEAREKCEQIIDELHDPNEGKKPRTYRKKARKTYLAFVRNRKPSRKQIRNQIKKQLGYVKRDLGIIDRMTQMGKTLVNRSSNLLETIQKLFEQQQFMYRNQVHQVENRIVSLSQPFIRPIVRGKARAPVEFGAKLDVSVANGYSRLEICSFDNYNESTHLQDIIRRYYNRTGHYPERVLADKIYRNRDNLRYCKELGIRLSGPALGKRGKDATFKDKQTHQDICDRVEVERRFSLAKRKCGMGLMRTKLSETTASAIALSIVVLNLRKIQRALLYFFSGLQYRGFLASLLFLI
jgi:hypothetical protein